MERQKRNSVKWESGQHVRRPDQKNRWSTGEQAVFLYLLIVFILVSIHMDRGNAPAAPDSIPMSENWTMKAGEVVSLSELPVGSLDLVTDVSGLNLRRRSLCLKSIDTQFDVYADGQRIYSYHPTIPKRLGASYGMYVHTIALPKDITSLTLRLEPVFPETPAALNDVVIEEGTEYVRALFKSNLWAFVLSSVILLIGLLFLTVGVFGKILMYTAGLDFVSFGVFCVLIGFTGFNDTLLLQVLTGHPALIRVITYVCLIFLPYPALSFFASATGNRRAFPVPASLVLCLANFGLQVFLTHRGISDYYYLVYISHVHIALAFLAAALLLVRAIYRHTIQKELLRSLIIGISACAIGGGLDIGRYYSLQSYGFTGYTRLGMLVFTLMMGFYLFHEQTRSLKLKQRENSLLISEITTAFAKVIDMKDSYTNGHSFRVAQYTSMLAKELGYDDETVERYYRIALLHDVGKIGIPKAVLNKPGKLTDEEFEIMKTHTTAGAEIISRAIDMVSEGSSGYLKEAKNLAHYHHEKWNGQGYPTGLSGEDIPLSARIMAVADVFDALVSTRSYKKGFPFEKAIAIIEESSGSHFDPKIAGAFLNAKDKAKEIADSHAEDVTSLL